MFPNYRAHSTWLEYNRFDSENVNLNAVMLGLKFEF